MPGSGFKNITAGLTATYRLTDRITLRRHRSAISLTGAVNDSPMVMHRTQPFGVLAVAYRMVGIGALQSAQPRGPA